MIAYTLTINTLGCYIFTHTGRSTATVIVACCLTHKVRMKAQVCKPSVIDH